MRKIIIGALIALSLIIGLTSIGIAADPVLIQSISLEQETVAVSVGKVVTLKPVIEPKNAKNKKLDWSSADENIATVDNGKVKGVALGNTTITAKAQDENEAEVTIAVSVVNPIEKISTETKLILAPETSWKPEITIEPENATIKTLAWSSSNEKTATVDEDGTIHAIAVGKCNVVGNAKDDSKKKVSISVQIVKHDVVITEPGEVHVDFATSGGGTDPNAVDEIKVTAKDGSIKTVTKDKLYTDENIANTVVRYDGRKIAVYLNENGDYEYYTLDPLTGRIMKTHIRNLTMTVYGSESKKTTSNGDPYTAEVTFKNGLVCEGSGVNTLRPLRAGSETVEMVTKKDGKKVVDKQNHSVFIAQSAILCEGDNEIGRLPAETYNGHTYQTFYSNRVWQDAEDFCEKHSGHLVTIESQNEQKFIERYLANAEKQGSYWIGLTNDESNGFSFWITKEKVDFTKWASDRPNANLSNTSVAIAASEYEKPDGTNTQRGYWTDESSSYYYIDGFICEWDEDNSQNALTAKE